MFGVAIAQEDLKSFLVHPLLEGDVANFALNSGLHVAQVVHKLLAVLFLQLFEPVIYFYLLIQARKLVQVNDRWSLLFLLGSLLLVVDLLLHQKLLLIDLSHGFFIVQVGKQMPNLIESVVSELGPVVHWATL